MSYIKKWVHIHEDGIYIEFAITTDDQLKLMHFSHVPYGYAPDYVIPENRFNTRDQFLKEGYQLVQMNLSGFDRPYERHGAKYIVTAPGYSLKFVDLQERETEEGKQLIITQIDELTRVEVMSTWQFYKGTSTIRMTHTVTNKGQNCQTLEYISSFNYLGIEKEKASVSPSTPACPTASASPSTPACPTTSVSPAAATIGASTDDKMRFTYARNGWQKEFNFITQTFPEMGFAYTQPNLWRRASNTFTMTNTGNWSTKEYLPLGFLENTEANTGLYFQIEHNGSWHAEIADQNDHYYLAIGGPNEAQSHWFKNLKPNDSFTTIPVAVGVSDANIEQAFGQLTEYRRRIRRKNADNEKLPVIFNDYMNCLFGDPTTEKEYPLVDAAADMGCEYFVIDAGWYAPGEWWDSVGEWQECRERFPKGVKEITDYARSKGLIPGVWLELEVMGINCEKAKKAPDDWFFLRHGKRVYDRSRYQLDFRNPEVIAHVDEVIDRVVRDYGVGYIKMDYNIEPGIGTEVNADSMGDGLLQHERAYLTWLDGVFKRYPDLVIENCSSGGLRIDYALLSRYSIQSSSDQEDYRHYATISANLCTGITPEQAAVWSYPMRNGDEEETIFNMVNAILFRIHQSGHLAELSTNRKALVKEAIDYYKKIRDDIKISKPFWPLGLADIQDSIIASGIKTENKAYLAVWKRPAKNGLDQTTIDIPLSSLNFKKVTVKLAYPAKTLEKNIDYHYNEATQSLSVTFHKDTMARLFEITF